MRQLPVLAAVTGSLLIASAVAAQGQDPVKAESVKVTAIGNALPDQTTKSVSPAPGVALPQGAAKSEDAIATCIDAAVPADKIKAMIEQEAARQGTDLKLALAIADQESGFGARVNSAAGARGPMQLMPDTAVRYAVKDVCDPAENIRGGVSFLKDLNVTFGGNVMLMVAAYNSGEARVFKAGGVPAIPETVYYVARVTNAYYEFDNALKGGKRAQKAGATARAVAAASTAVPKEAGTAVDDEAPIPINAPNAAPNKGGQRWVGDSVLYVDSGDVQ